MFKLYSPVTPIDFNIIREIHDVLAESSPVPSSVLRPFQLLEWNISPQVAKDIEIAKEKIDKLVHVCCTVIVVLSYWSPEPSF